MKIVNAKREIPEGHSKCPRCLFIGETEEHFGYRWMNGKKRSQSQCRMCRSSGSKRPAPGSRFDDAALQKAIDKAIKCPATQEKFCPQETELEKLRRERRHDWNTGGPSDPTYCMDIRTGETWRLHLWLEYDRKGITLAYGHGGKKKTVTRAWIKSRLKQLKPGDLEHEFWTQYTHDGTGGSTMLDKWEPVFRSVISGDKPLPKRAVSSSTRTVSSTRKVSSLNPASAKSASLAITTPASANVAAMDSTTAATIAMDVTSDASTCGQLLLFGGIKPLKTRKRG